MSRDVNGNYTLPAGNPVTSGTTISSTWGNTTMSDLATAMTDSLSRNGYGGMLVPFKMLDGTVGAPGLTFTTETTLGLYRSAAGIVGFAVSGVEVAQARSTGLTALALIPSGSTVPANGLYLPAANTLGLASNTTIRGTVNSTGNWVVKVPSSGNTLDIDSLTGSNALIMRQSAGGGAVSMSLIAGYDFRITSNNTGNLSITNATLATTPLNIGPTGALTIAAPTSGNNAVINSLGGTTALGLVSTTAGFTALDLTDGQAGTRRWEIISGFPAAGSFGLYDATAGATRLSIDTSGNTTIQDGAGTSYAAGFRGLPIDTTFATSININGVTPNGKMRRYTGGSGDTVTIQDGAVSGQLVTILNNGGGTLAIADGLTGVLRWFSGSAATDGNRTLAVGGVITLLWNDTQNVFCWGAGIT